MSAPSLNPTIGVKNPQIRQNLLDLDPNGLRAYCESIGEKSFRATQLLKWVYQQGVLDYDAMTNISKASRAALLKMTVLAVPEVVLVKNSLDGTRKWLLKLHDGNCIEMVFIPEEGRGTLCISSQVGCTLTCSFCATARQGFNRNLTVSEIIGQLWVAASSLDQFGDLTKRKITNVVMMGMGEPLLNFDNVVKAMRLMMDDNAFGLSKRRVTLSTSGVVPALDKLREQSHVSLAVSLHATTDVLRDQLVPINKKYPIADLLAACERYTEGENKRTITFEYVMLAGVNDQPDQAKALVKLLKPLPAKVNLIPFNPFPNVTFKCSSNAVIERFKAILIERGLIATIRRTRGDDIDAACGQLAGQIQDRTRRSTKDLNLSVRQVT